MKKAKVTRFAPKMKIKKGDKVQVIAGAYKGYEGEVREVLVNDQRVIVSDVNMATKHTKPTQNNPGGINKVEAPIHISNVMIIDPKNGETSRIGRKEVDGKLVRYSKKSGEILK